MAFNINCSVRDINVVFLSRTPHAYILCCDLFLGISVSPVAMCDYILICIFTGMPGDVSGGAEDLMTKSGTALYRSSL